MQHEYYIRQPSDTDARGPFTLRQLADLASSGGLDSQTLYYDANADEWRNVQKSSDLSLVAMNAAPFKSDSSSSADSSNAQTASPALSPKIAAILLFASALVMLVPLLLRGGSLDVHALLRFPYVWLGALNLVLGCLVLWLRSRVFRFVRIYAALELGFLGVLFWLQANYLAFGCALVAALCLVLATLLSTSRALIATATAGLAALGILAYCLLS